MSRNLIAVGSAVKAGKDGKVMGRLIRFTSKNEKDADGQYFDSRTDFFGVNECKIVWYHGWSSATKAAPVGAAKLQKSKYGIEIDGLLDLSSEVGEKIFAKAKNQELGWSSDSSAHLIEVEPDGRIARWPIVAASLAPAKTVKDQSARVVVPTKAFRAACKAGGIPVSLVDSAKLGVLRQAFEALIKRLDLISQHMKVQEPTLDDVLSASEGVRWRMEYWEKQLAEELGSIATKARSIQDLDGKIEAILGSIKQMTNDASPSNGEGQAADSGDGDLALALIL